MGAPSETYVDPSIAGNSGTGTIGDPYGDLQYAFDQVTQDGTNGDRFNVLAGTDEILAANLTLATYGSPSDSFPVIIQGYTSAAGDGGIGGISGAATYEMFSGSISFVHFIDMHCHNTGSASIVNLGFGGYAIRCEFDNSTAAIAITLSQPGAFLDSCYVHNCSGIGVVASADGAEVRLSYFANGTNDFTHAISMSGDGCTAYRNILTLDGSSNGIRITSSNGQKIVNNSILSASGTGAGVFLDSSPDQPIVVGNAVEGFSGAGGIGFDLTGGSNLSLYGNNAAFNNTTNYSLTDDVGLNVGDNETLGATPFDKSGSDTFANRVTYFGPVDTGNMRNGAWPAAHRLDKGAVQHADPAGGGGTVNPFHAKVG